MIKKLQKAYTITDGVTQSMLASFLTCRQKSRFEVLQRYESAFSNFGGSAVRGDFFHTLLEYWYDGRVKDTVGELDPKAFVHAVEKMYIEKAKKRGPIDIKELDDTFAFSRAIFPTYVEVHKKSDAKKEWESLEEVFDVKWKRWRLRGKFDGVFKRTGVDGRWLFETKTKAQIDEDGIIDQLSFDFQNLFYLTVLSSMGRRAVGVVYNVVRKPSLRQKKGESLDEFTSRIAEDVPARRAHYFKRYEVTYTPATVARFQDELEFKLRDFEAFVKGEIPTYRNEGACFGKMKCSFLKACSSGTMVGYKQSRVLFRELLPNE